MKTRYLAVWLLGAWVAGGLFMFMVATQNFRSVDRLLAAPAPPAAARITVLGHDEARALLRYQVSEQNRFYFETWEKIQLGLGLALLAVCLAGLRRQRLVVIIAAAMLLGVMAERLWMTPEIVRLGRRIDFVPADLPSADRKTFWAYHGAYSSLELLKLGAGFFLAGWLGFRGGRGGQQAAQVDAVNEADHRHVNR